MNKADLRGVLAFPVTPMDDSGTEVDLLNYQELVDWQINEGVHGIIAMGSTGEFAYLSSAERRVIIDATVDAVGGRVPAIVGVSSVGTADARELAAHAETAGADAVLLSIPTYYALSADEVCRHVESVVASSSLPLVLYNNPYTSKVDLTPDILDRLVGLPSLVGVKEASMDLDRISDLRARYGSRLEILGGGFDPYAFPALCLGASGWTTGMSNLVPSECASLFAAVTVERDLERARAIHYKLLPLAHLLVELRLSVALKAGLRLLGRSAGSPRHPLQPLAPEDVERLQRALDDLGVGAGSGARG